MILGSHNSWSYAKPKKWWMRFFRWCVRCQDYDIRMQYELFNVRCFDLRVTFDSKGYLKANHNLCTFNISLSDLEDDLEYLNKAKDCCVRVLLDTRTSKKHNAETIYHFIRFCKELELKYKDITFFGGTNLYDGNVDYAFDNKVNVGERCASVMPPKWLNGLYPRCYAKKHNAEIKDFGTSKDVLLIDFVNI